jgi:cytochrome P450
MIRNKDGISKGINHTSTTTLKEGIRTNAIVSMLSRRTVATAEVNDVLVAAGVLVSSAGLLAALLLLLSVTIP